MRHPILLLAVFALGWLAHGRAGPPVAQAAGPPDFAEVIARSNPGVVRIAVRSARPSRQASRDDGVGAGFVVAADGWIVTCLHVVGAADQVVVTAPGRGSTEARVVGRDAATDTALLRVAWRGMKPLPRGGASRVRPGQWVLAGGSPYNLENSWSVGIVSGVARSNVGVGPRAVRDYIQTDAAANLGNSGGPLLDAGGRVIGMMTAILSRTGGHQGVALAVPIDLVDRAVEALRRGGGSSTVDRPTLGLRVRAMPSIGGRPAGLVVTGFEANSAAEANGVRPGDVILVGAGRALRKAADLQRLVGARVRGEILRLTLQRGNRRLEVRVPLR